MDQRIEPYKRAGEIQIPPSKSDAQRAFLAAALAKGTSIIRQSGKSDDELKMLESIKLFGAIVTEIDETTIEITGTSSFPHKLILHVGESGLGARLLTCVCAAHDGEFVLEGKGSLLKRNMAFFDTIMPILNVKFKSRKGYLPFKLKGPMQSTDLVVDGSQSSQYISGLLMSLPLIEGTTNLTVENLTSIPYLKMTLNTLAAFGIEIQQQDYKEFIIGGKQKYLSTNYTVEGDWSSASYFLVASALGSDIKVKGLAMSSLQADKKILDAFISANCSVIHSNDGISVDGSNRIPFTFDATNCPDLFPALVTLASLTNGISSIKGVKRLASKESDRGKSLQVEFAKLGIEIFINEDVMYIHGKESISGGKVHSHDDHRIAMCLGIAGFYSDQAVIIEDAETVSKSYPDFWVDLSKLEMVV